MQRVAVADASMKRAHVRLSLVAIGADTQLTLGHGATAAGAGSTPLQRHSLHGQCARLRTQCACDEPVYAYGYGYGYA